MVRARGFLLAVLFVSSITVIPALMCAEAFADDDTLLPLPPPGLNIKGGRTEEQFKPDDDTLRASPVPTLSFNGQGTNESTAPISAQEPSQQDPWGLQNLFSKMFGH